MRFYLVVKSTFQGYQARVSKLSVSWQSENAIAADSLNQRFKVLRKEWEYSSFLRPENAILPSREIHVSKVPSYVKAIFPQVPSFVLANYLHFVCLKMRFLPI